VLRKMLGWLLVIVIIGGGFFLLKDYFNPGLEVQLVTASLTSPAQANAVLTASGYVVARRKAAVASKGTGTLVYLGVEEGDRVKKGQEIARLENADVLAALQRAKENLRVEEADLKDAKQSLERQRILVKGGFVAQAEFDAAEARYNRVVASIDAAKSAVKEGEVAVDNTRIVAPFDGVVTEKMVEPGNMAAPGTPLMRVEDTRRFRLDVRVDESRIGRVSAGATVAIAFDGGSADTARLIDGTVTEVGQAADAGVRSFLVKIELPDDRGLRSGMFGRARFNSKPRRALVVPEAALVHRGQVTSVFVVEHDTARVRLVNVRGAEVLAGLSEGDVVIVTPPPALTDGSRVTVGGR